MVHLSFPALIYWNSGFCGLQTLGLVLQQSSSSQVLGLELGVNTIVSPCSQNFRLERNYITNFPGFPTFRWQTVGILSFHDPVNRIFSPYILLVLILLITLTNISENKYFTHFYSYVIFLYLNIQYISTTQHNLGNRTIL